MLRETLFISTRWPQLTARRGSDRSNVRGACLECADATTASAWPNPRHRAAHTRRRFACLLCGLALSLAACPGDARQAAPNTANSAPGIDHNNMAVIVNTADALSVAAGEYHARARQVPSSNLVRVRFTPGAP